MPRFGHQTSFLPPGPVPTGRSLSASGARPAAEAGGSFLASLLALTGLLLGLATSAVADPRASLARCRPAVTLPRGVSLLAVAPWSGPEAALVILEDDSRGVDAVLLLPEGSGVASSVLVPVGALPPDVELFAVLGALPGDGSRDL